MQENRQESDTIEIIPINQQYGYDLMKQNINELKRAYPFLEIRTAGYSVLGKPIPYIKIGNGTKQVLYHASIHANEWITSVLLMKFIENFCRAYIFNQTLQGYSVRELFKNISLYIIPMVNPDGVDVVTGNVDPKSKIYQNYVDIAYKFSNIPFPEGWKANFNGVDLKNYQPVCKVL